MPNEFVDQRGRDLYVAARRVLLDALEALVEQRAATVLVGAQAVYLRCGDADLGVAVYTKDADIGIDPRRLSDRPRLEEAMRGAGFELAEGSQRQPGQWFRAERVGGTFHDIPVDLLVPEQLAGTGSRRSARIPPHDRLSARKVAGLELMTVDNEAVRIESLEPETDRRSVEARVAGPAALLIAKAYKIQERLEDIDPGRAVDKDAGDVLRLMVGSNAREVARTLRRLLNDPEVGMTARTGLGYLTEQFGGTPRRARGAEMAVRALAGARPREFVEGLAAAYARTLARSVGES